MPHTPGPWTCEPGTNQMVNNGTTVATMAKGGLVTWYIFSDAEKHGDRMADAKLIAAAPELLEALKSCKYLIEEAGVKNWTGQQFVENAIKKATE